MGGVEFQLPEEIYVIAISNVPPGERIDRIASDPWTYQQAEQICEELIKPKGENRKKCTEHMLHTIAASIVTGEEIGDE